MHECSSLLHHPYLVPPEKMLAGESSSLKGKVLCAFLKTMDSVEWTTLKNEESQLSLSNWDVESLPYYQTIGIYVLGGGVVGGMCAAAVTTFSNPITAIVGITTGGLFGFATIKDYARRERTKACLDITIKRNCRRSEKQSAIEKRAQSLKSALLFSYESELEQLDTAMIYFSDGIRSIGR